MCLKLVAGGCGVAVVLAGAVACVRGTPIASHSSCADVAAPKTPAEAAAQMDRLIPNAVTALGEPGLDSYAGKGSVFIRAGFGIGDDANVSSIERSSDGCTMSMARKTLNTNACNVVHAQAFLPAWQCDYFVECMLNPKDWDTLQSRVGPLQAEGFEWVEATDGNWKRVTEMKSGGSEVPVTRLETCFKEWRTLAWALAKSVGYKG